MRKIFKKLAAALNPHISIADAKQLLANGAILIDVRSPEEYAKKHAATSVNMPLDAIESGVCVLPNEPIVFYCKSGVRCQIATKIAKDKNQRVYSLGGLEKALQLGEK